MRPAAEILGLTNLLDRYPAPALRRPAPARGDGPGDRARPAGLPLRRAALEPRRQAARLDAGGDQEPAPAAEDDDGLRHPRPDRGDDDGRQDRRHARRPGRADRRAARPLRQAGQPLRRGLHRLAGDEHADRPDRRRWRRFVTGDGIALPVGRPLAAAPAGAVVYGLRPESMHLGGEVPLRVDVVEPTGSETHVLGHSARPRSSASSASASGRSRARRSASRSTRRRRISSTPPPGRASRPEGARRRGRRPFGQIQSRDKEVTSREQHHPQRPAGRRRRPRRRQRARRAAPSRRRSRPTRPRRAPRCACCAGCRSSRARRRPGTPTPRPSPRRPASRCGSTRRAGRTCAPRPPSPPTSAPGPDMVMSWFDDPFQYPDKLIDVTELAEAVGAANGGWYDGPKGYAVRDGKFIAMPLCAIGNAICYRESHVEAAGFTEFPTDSAGFLELCKALQGEQHPGRLPARQGGRRRQQLRPLAAVEQRRQDDRRGRHGRRSTAPRRAPRSSTPRSSTRPSSPAPRAGSTSTTTAPSSPGRCR